MDLSPEKFLSFIGLLSSWMDTEKSPGVETWLAVGRGTTPRKRFPEKIPS